MTNDDARASEEFLGLLDLVGRAFEVEVDDAFLEEVRAYAAEPAVDLVPEAQKYAERGAHQLNSALTAYDKADDPALWRDYLDASYAELFLGVSPQASEPVESCYRHDERVLYAQEFFQVKELMDAHGFQAPSHFLEPVDHLAMEWAFFTELLRSGNYEVARAFKADHLDPWVGDALTQLVDADDVGFYTAIANLARAGLFESEALLA